MAVFRIKKNENYTVMSNHHFKNRKLSLKAKGLLSLMLSLPDDWDYTQEGLVSLNADGRDSVRTAIQELENEGYLIVGQEKTESGKFSNAVYDVYENPLSENPITEKPISENPTQLNTKELITNKSNTNKFNKPSIEDIQAYIDEKGMSVNAEVFFDYYESKGWMIGRTKMKDYKATLRNWERRANESKSNQSNKARNRGVAEEVPEGWETMFGR